MTNYLSVFYQLLFLLSPNYFFIITKSFSMRMDKLSLLTKGCMLLKSLSESKQYLRNISCGNNYWPITIKIEVRQIVGSLDNCFSHAGIVYGLKLYITRLSVYAALNSTGIRTHLLKKVYTDHTMSGTWNIT